MTTPAPRAVKHLINFGQLEPIDIEATGISVDRQILGAGI